MAFAPLRCVAHRKERCRFLMQAPRRRFQCLTAQPKSSTAVVTRVPIRHVEVVLSEEQVEHSVIIKILCTQCLHRRQLSCIRQRAKLKKNSFVEENSTGKTVISREFISPNAGPINRGNAAAANNLLRVTVPRMCRKVFAKTSRVRIGFHCFVFASAKASASSITPSP